MALKLDNSLLEELGLGSLPEHEKQLLLRQIYERLEMNVGVRLADQMSNEQLDEFEKFVDANDDKGAFQWLETNFPNYKDVVNEEFEKLKVEIKQYAPQMLAVAAQNSQGAAGASQVAPGVAAAPGQPAPQQGYQNPAAPYQPQPGVQSQPPQPGMQGGGYPQQPQYGQPQQPYYGQQSGYGQPQPGYYQQPQNPAPNQPQYPPYPSQQPPAGPGQQAV